MSFPTDFPLLGGFLYCKLLSPAKALDWMYTDSLRSQTPLSKLVNEGLLSPAQFLARVGRIMFAVPLLLSFLLTQQNDITARTK